MKWSASLLVVALPLACLPTLHGAEPTRKPNILFAVADDWSYGHAGAYGCKWVRTPAMDRVAREGILFSHAYTPTGKCAPSRACFITGRNPWQLKAAANHVCFFPPEFTSFPEALGTNGYFTGMTGKGWAPGVALDASGKKREMTGRPFNKRQGRSPTSEISSNDYASNFGDFLDAVPKDTPWCFWYGGLEPHRGYEFGSGAAKGGKKTTDIERIPACWPDNDTVRNDLLDYAFEVEHFDEHLRRILAKLEERGLLDNTLVIVTSDNGMPFPHDKGHAYNDSNHLPLAIMWKSGIRNPGRTVDDYVSVIDFAPTSLDVAGIEWDKTGMAPATGRSLRELFASEKSGRVNPQRDHVLIGKERTDVGRPHDWGYPIRGIIREEMLYLHNFEPTRWPAGNPETGYPDTDGSPTKTEVLKSRLVADQTRFWELCFGKRCADELYNLRTDPDCVANLAATVPFAPLKQQLFDELVKQDDPRMSGNGRLFDEYPCANRAERGLYESFMRGERTAPSWINASDCEKEPLK